MLALLTGALLALGQAPQALVSADGISITSEEYGDYLRALAGRSRLQELLLDRILEREVQALDHARVATEVSQGLEHPDEAVERAMAARIATEHGGDHAAFFARQAEVGFGPAELRAAQRIATLRELRIAALVQASREPTEPLLRALFDHQYGVDGQHVEVRHVLVSLHAERRRLAATAAAPGDAEVVAAARARIERAAAELRAGKPFFEVVAAYSDDPAARQPAADPAARARAGRIDGYNYQHYGSELALAVRRLAPGEVSPPVETSHGFHLVVLDARVTTRFADVQDALHAALRDAPPTLAEQRLLHERLAAQYGVREALAAALQR